MARLSLFLPPPAGDYSGAAGVLFGLDCLVVLVDAGCCTRNYTEYDEPRWARRRKTAFSAQLRTLEAVLGDEERIVEQTAEGVHELGVSCAALLGTPVPAVTGMNLLGIACDIEARAACPPWASKRAVSRPTSAAEAVGSTTASMSRPACTAPADEDIHETASPTLAGAALSPILLLGEQVAMCSLRTHVHDALAQAGLSASVVVATRFSADPTLAEPGDLSEVGERELIAWVRKNPGFTWVGDPLFERIPAFSSRSAAMLPHEATSSTLYTDLAKELAGDAALSHVQRGIMERCVQKTQAE